MQKTGIIDIRCISVKERFTVCPDCSGQLKPDGQELICKDCSARHDIEGLDLIDTRPALFAGAQ